MEIALCILIVVLVLLIRLATRWPRRDVATDTDRRATALAKRARELPATKIRDVTEGTNVRVTGKVRLFDGWVMSPISKRACAYWRLRISVLEYSAAVRGEAWRCIAERSGSCPFTLASGADVCRVDPKRATVQVSEGTRVAQYPGRWLPSRNRAALATAGISIERIQNAQVRFEESILAFDTPGAIVGAGAVVQRAPKMADTPYREALETWLQFDGEHADLLVSDDVRLLRPSGVRPIAKPKREKWVSTTSNFHEFLPNGGAMPYLEEVERYFARRQRLRVIKFALAGTVVVVSALVAMAFGVA